MSSELLLEQSIQPYHEMEVLYDGIPTKYKKSRQTKCSEIDCNKKPAFNYPTEKVGRYCCTHKLKGMINVVAKRCLHLGCSLHPSYNYPHVYKRLYCNKHKLKGMISISSYYRCIVKNCLYRASYNYPWEKNQRMYCAHHRKMGMIHYRYKKLNINNLV